MKSPDYNAFEDSEPSTCDSLVCILEKFGFVPSKAIAEMVAENSNNLLFDQLLHYLRHSPTAKGKYLLLNAISKNGIDPTKDLIELVESSLKFNYIWQKYEQESKLVDYSFSKAKELHTHLSGLGNLQVQMFFNKMENFGTAAAKLALNQSSRQNISTADQKKEEEWIEQQLEKSSDLRQLYDDLVYLSKEMSEYAGSKYDHRPIICYFATKSVMSAKSFLQMPPGAGKTWVCLLIAKYWSKMDQPLEAVYVVLNDGLKE